MKTVLTEAERKFYEEQKTGEKCIVRAYVQFVLTEKVGITHTQLKKPVVKTLDELVQASVQFAKSWEMVFPLCTPDLLVRLDPAAVELAIQGRLAEATNHLIVYASADAWAHYDVAYQNHNTTLGVNDISPERIVQGLICWKELPDAIEMRMWHSGDVTDENWPCDDEAADEEEGAEEEEEEEEEEVVEVKVPANVVFVGPLFSHIYHFKDGAEFRAHFKNLVRDEACPEVSRNCKRKDITGPIEAAAAAKKAKLAATLAHLTEYLSDE